ncbi:hypothetical protein HYH02_011070 [Chlamydomonas schloesseri]|uniref:Protein kinase domain-containing protein n=1 Tax=Chlamydomonas schloesseri TaxID=2026947 RepID=A0A835T2D4_9CHLO|nr:hypothetical protein HYH02_011070 [Chlamydomonas schloesseri]|eukprot:KAG2437692.1 hypothetical protein HYH02_011070 [Chlamydomonas schloesseri]
MSRTADAFCCAPAGCPALPALQVRLAPGVTLGLRRILVRRSRSDPSWRGPGLDLITDDSGRDLTGADPAAFAVVEVADSVNLQEVCLPPAYVPLSMGTMTWPAELQLPPFRQSGFSFNTTQQLHPNCTDRGGGTTSNTDLPYEQQCILSGGIYNAIGLYCYSIDAFGNQVKTGYVSLIRNSEFQCYTKMTVECISSHGGVVGCYNYMSKQMMNNSFTTTSSSSNNNATAVTNTTTTTSGSNRSSSTAAAVAAAPAGSANTPPLPPGAIGSSAGTGGDGGAGSGDSAAVTAGAVVGSVVGGLLLAAVIVVLVVLVRRRRQSAKHAKQQRRQHSPETGPASCGDRCGAGAPAACAGAAAAAARGKTDGGGKAGGGGGDGGAAAFLLDSPATAAAGDSSGGDSGSHPCSGDGFASATGTAAGTAAGGYVSGLTLASAAAAPSPAAVAGAGGGSAGGGSGSASDGGAAAAAAAVAAAAQARAAAAAAAAYSMVPVTALTPLNANIPLNIMMTTTNTNTNTNTNTTLTVSSAGAPALGSSTAAAGSEHVVSGHRKPPAPGAAELVAGAAGKSGSSSSVTTTPPPATPEPSGGHGPTSPQPPPLVMLFPGQVIGKGSYGKVVEGLYGGRRVAVKLIDTGLLLPGAFTAGAAAAAAAAATRGALPPPPPPPPAWAYTSLSVSTADVPPPLSAEAAAAAAAAAAAVEPPSGTGAVVGTAMAAAGAATSSQQAAVVANAADAEEAQRAEQARRQAAEANQSTAAAAALAAVAAAAAVEVPDMLAVSGVVSSDDGRLLLGTDTQRYCEAVLQLGHYCGAHEAGGGGGGLQQQQHQHQQLSPPPPPPQVQKQDAHVAHGGGAATLISSGAAGAAAAAEAAAAEEEEEDAAVRDLISSLGQEVEVLARVRHDNIVTLLAANLRPPHVCLVMERMDTSLDRLLHKEPGRRLQLDTALHIALQVARALQYLHPTIIHRDLKPANVLISHADGDGSQLVAKLADFGLSRLRNTVLVTCNPEVGTGPYMAPECFDLATNVIMDRADCYSFGVLLWELVTRRRPWEGLSMVAVAVRVAVRGERLPLAPLEAAGAPAKLVRLVASCFEADPRRRPAAAEVVKTLLLVQEQMKLGTEAGLGKMLGF